MSSTQQIAASVSVDPLELSTPADIATESTAEPQSFTIETEEFHATQSPTSKAVAGPTPAIEDTGQRPCLSTADIPT